MSIFSTLFSPLEKWRESPNREEKPPHTFNQQIQSIDKTESTKIDGIEEITISARTNVILSTTQSDELVVRIHGMVTTNYAFDAYVTQIEKIIRIRAKESNSTAFKTELEKKEKDGKSKEGVATHSFANITLELEIPEHSEIKRIKVKNSNGNIICKTPINLEYLEIINKNGNIQVSSSFKKLIISSKTGDVNVKTTASSDLHVEIDSNDGSVCLNIDNIRNVYMHYQSDGACLINPKYFGEYEIHGKVYVSKGSLIYC